MEARDPWHSASTTNRLGARINPTPAWSHAAKAQGSQIIAEGKIFYWGVDDSLTAANPATGQMIWSSPSPPPLGAGYRGHAYANGVIYSSTDFNVDLRRASNGNLITRLRTYSGYGWYSPTVGDGVLLGTDLIGCHFWAYGDYLGTDTWLWAAQLPNECTNRPGAAIKNGVAYIANGAGFLTGVRIAGGQRVFQKRLNDYAYVAASPLVDSGGRIVLGVWDGVSDAEQQHHWWYQQLARGVRRSEQGDIMSLDANTGDIRWSYRTVGRIDSAPVEVDGTIVAIDRAGITYGVDADTGVLRWQWVPPGYQPPSAPHTVWAVQTLMVSGDQVYVPHPDGNVYTLDGRTGQQLASITLPARPYYLAADGESDLIYVWYSPQTQGNTTINPVGTLAAFHTSSLNEPPQAEAGPQIVVPEGESAQLDATASTDADGDPLSYQWKRTNSDGPAATLSSTTSPQPNFDVTDDSTNDFNLKVTDDDGAASTDTVRVVGENKPPVVNAPGGSAQADGAAVMTATFTDPGLLDTHTATIDWGDGTPSEPAAVTQGTGWGTVVAGHRYAQPGSYEVTVTVTDDDGGSGSNRGSAARFTVTRGSSAVWATAQNGFPSIFWAGSGNRAGGLVHANGDLKILGQGNSFEGSTEYAGRLIHNAQGTTFASPPVQVAASSSPVSFALADYRPGGSAAGRAGVAYHDMTSSCTGGAWNINGVHRRLDPGVYYAPCDIHVLGTGISGAVTLVSENDIFVKGAGHNLQAYLDGLLLLSGEQADDSIDFSGQGSNLSGVTYSKSGEVQIGGTGLRLTCSVVAERIKVNGNDIAIDASDCSSGAASAVALSTLAPNPSLSITPDRDTASPGDTVNYAVQLSNTGSTLVAAGLIGAENTGTQTAIAKHWSFELQYRSAADGRWRTLAGANASDAGFVPVETPSVETSARLTASPVTWPGAVYADSGDRILNTSVSPGGQAVWAYQARVELSPSEVRMLHDPGRVSAVRGAAHLEFGPTDASMREFYRVGGDFSTQLRAQSPDLTNAVIDFVPPVGDPSRIVAASVPQLESIAPGETAVAGAGFQVEVPAPKSQAESSIDYQERLYRLNNSRLHASAGARANSSLGRSYVPQARASVTEGLPLLDLGWLAPQQIQHGDSVDFEVRVDNDGLRRAEDVRITSDMNGVPQPPVNGTPNQLDPGDDARVSVPLEMPANVFSNLLNRALVTWRDSNGNAYGPVVGEHVTSVLPPANLRVTKTVRLAIDADGDGDPTPGDTLEYEIKSRNTTSGAAADVVLTDTPDPNTQLLRDSVTTTHGSIDPAGIPDIGDLRVRFGTVAGGEIATVVFRAKVRSELPANISSVINQAFVSVAGSSPLASDDPSRPGASDPTATYVNPDGPRLRATLRDSLTDVDDNGVLNPGDTIEYEASISNAGAAEATGVRFTIDGGALTDVVGGSVTTTQGKIWNGSRLPDSTVDVEPGTIAPGGSAMIRFKVRVNTVIPVGVEKIFNQGTVVSDQRGSMVTDDPDTTESDDQTGTKTAEFSALSLSKRDALAVDADGNGVASAGDSISYTVVAENNSDDVVHGVMIGDTPGAMLAVESGTVVASQGAVLEGNRQGDSRVRAAVGSIAPGERAQVTFRARIATPLPTGTQTVGNQASAWASDVSVRLSDDPDTPAVGDVTLTSIQPTPYLTVVTTQELAIDADGNGVVSPGDSVEYVSSVRNDGALGATAASFTASPGDNLTLLNGSVVTTNGGVVSGNGAGQPSAAVSIGDLAIGQATTIRYRMLVAPGISADVKSVNTSGSVSAAEIGVRRIDPLAKTPVVQTHELPPSLTAIKSDALALDADANGKASPGDTLSYTVTLFNSGDGAANDVVFTDVPGAYTTLVAGSVQTDSTATIKSGNGAGDTLVELHAEQVMPHQALAISFQARIDEAFPVGVNSVLNQGSVASRELETVPTLDPDASAPGGATRTPVEPPPVTPPVVRITAPVSDHRVTAPTGVTAEIIPPTGQRIATWCVHARGQEGASRELACGTGTPPTSLAQFDPTLLQNGAYMITVTATATGGGSAESSVDVAVDGNLKLGRFTTAYQDMNVPIHSLPIQILRTYDSIDKQKRDFGIGWSLEIANIKVQTNGPLGAGGWSAQPSGCMSILGQGICLSKSFKRLAPHFVTVRWPDGRQEVFDFTPSAGADLYYDASAAFTGRSGSTSKLEVDGDPYIQYLNDGNIYNGDLTSHFDPQRFRLTAKDGTTYVIDRDQGVISATDRHGNYLQVTRDGVISSTGKSITFTRDAQDRITKLRGPSGEVVQYAYGPTGDLTNVTDARANTMRFTYDAGHNLLVSKDPQNRPFRTIAYDDSGRMTSVTDGAGNTTQIDTSLGDRQQVITSPDGRLTSVTSFDTRGNLSALVESFDSTNRTTTYEYDENDNLVKTTDPLGAITRATFDSQGNQTSSTSTRGFTTNYEYDASGELTKETKPDGTVTQITRDPYGSPIRIDRGTGRATDIDYNPAGLPVKITDPLNREVKFSYDAAGNLTSQSDAAGSSSATYNAAGLVATRTDAVGATTAFEYDLDGNLTKVTDANGGVTRFSYDFLGRLTSETDQLGAITTYTYDAAGRLVTRHDRNGETSTFDYDAAGRLKTKQIPGAGTTNITYDGAGRPAVMENPDARLEYDYDAADRVTGVTSSGTPTSDQPTATFTYAYDAAGNRTQMQRGGITTDYTYDSLDRLSSLTDSTVGTFAWNRDPLGRLTSLTRPNNVTTTYSWDAADQIKDIVHAGPMGIVDEAHYQYDAAGRRTQVTDHFGPHAYSYDAAGQLTGADNPASQPDEAYTYDLLGNRISGGHGGQIHDAANRLMMDNKFIYAYDAEGSLIAKTDRALNATTTFAYDAEHRLRSVTSPSGAVTSYRYDPLGRRIEVAGHSETERFVYGADQNMAARYDGNNGVDAQFTFGLGMDTPLAMSRGGSRLYYQQDAIGSVSSLSDTAAAVAQRYEYGAFGKPLSSIDLTGNGFTYAAREWDSEQAAYFYRARLNDAASGRFTSEDPVPATNEYVYAVSDPVMLRDPDGRFSLIEQQGADTVKSELDRISNTSGAQRGLEVARALGRQGEETGLKALNAAKNTSRFNVGGRTRIPDVFRAANLVGEIKNVAYLARTAQISDYVILAARNGVPLTIVVRVGTRISGPLLELVCQGSVEIIRAL